MSVRWRGDWCVGWGTAVQTCSESCMSTQTPCSQFCVEPAASVVDASAVWHGTASVPGGRFWQYRSAHAATSRCCWLGRRRVLSCSSPVSSGSDCRPVCVPDRSTIGGIYGRWLVHENCTTGSPPERVYRKPDGDLARHRALWSRWPPVAQRRQRIPTWWLSWQYAAD